jgi:hypothetical protein
LIAGRDAPMIIFPPSILRSITLKSIPKTYGSDEEREALLSEQRRVLLNSIIAKKTSQLTELQREDRKHKSPNDHLCDNLNLHGISYYIHEIRKNFQLSLHTVNLEQPDETCNYADWPIDNDLAERVTPSNQVMGENRTLNVADFLPIPLNHLFFTTTTTLTLLNLLNQASQKFLLQFRVKSNNDTLKKEAKKAKFQEQQANNNAPANISVKEYSVLMKKLDNLHLKLNRKPKNSGNGHGRQMKGKPVGQDKKGKGKGKPRK